MSATKTDSTFLFKDKETNTSVVLSINYQNRSYSITPPFNSKKEFVFSGSVPLPPMHKPGIISQPRKTDSHTLMMQAMVIKLIAEAMDFIDTEFQKMEGGSLHKPTKFFIVTGANGAIHGCFTDRDKANQFIDNPDMNVLEMDVQ